MNLKRIFGALLTLLGIGGLIYTAILAVNTSGGSHNIKALVIYVAPRKMNPDLLIVLFLPIM